ncbi:MAG: ferrous iron transport protein A [Candidatus Omnitrophica bacterium CG07_land_8_20_14_0_80_42_15]|uniref:Ferrous iron transport protein A n=1 Tax=Candidatus Aquitaenariimonas noxiae TaxID=1974741 RepID=A0A2J0KRW5_9BACT|nr:MAG: ferrous iron transport protein A [Candidatus Omnitrophica bacterium CG07_land_8_20_14_0_80_42_15]
MRRITLVQIKPNRKAKVAEISGGANLQNKLMHMGIFKGKEMTKLSHIGLRGPVVIKTGRSMLAIGHGIATKIILEVE